MHRRIVPPFVSRYSLGAQSQKKAHLSIFVTQSLFFMVLSSTPPNNDRPQMHSFVCAVDLIKSKSHSTNLEQNFYHQRYKGFSKVRIMTLARNSKVYRLFVLGLRRNFDYRNSTRILALSTVTSSNQDDYTVKSLADIPGPKSLPVVGTGWTLLVGTGGERLEKRLLSSQMQDVREYGYIHKHRFGGNAVVQLADPSDVAKVMRAESKYPERFRFPAIDYYREKRQKTAGIFFADGPEWYRHRSVLSKRMLRPKQVADYAAEFNEIITDFIHRLRTIREQSGTDKDNEVRELDNELFKWSFESVAFMLFEKRFGCLEPEVNAEAQTFIKAVGEFLYSTTGVSLWPLWIFKIYETKQFKQLFRSFDTMYEYAELFTQRRINELELKSSETSRFTDYDKAGFFEFLLSSGKITKDDFLASVIDVLFAGVDTTSNTMQWMLYMMAKNPEKQEVLRQEVLSVLGNETIATPTTLEEMPYIKAWVRETLRLYPVSSALFRILPKDMMIRDFHIPAGTQIIMLLYAMSRDENVFPQPEKFKPERWLRDRATKSKFNDAKEVFSSMPFGFGTRMCLGRRIAELELYLLLARIVQRFEIRYPPDEIVEPFVRGVIIPDRPLRVQLIDRKY
ncbi:25-hydroxyvitamin D-1 alpha hydroxylase, mitochondrial-like [Montipora foliosa]|uniref:25-hydroxyvitamin D-1 alpha hydroxylase, mitochondrial-like n=1 Tax=Montipora foliosa TaxID=591990 RepID=UPI0035F1448F